MLNLNSLMVGSVQPKVLGDFYEKVFGRAGDIVEDNKWYGWQVGASFFTIGEHDKMGSKTTDPGRVMFVLTTEDVKAEFERIKEIGAEVIKEPYEMQGMWIATFADPDGNYFQLMSIWESKEEKLNN